MAGLSSIWDAIRSLNRAVRGFRSSPKVGIEDLTARIAAVEQGLVAEAAKREEIEEERLEEIRVEPSPSAPNKRDIRETARQVLQALPRPTRQGCRVLVRNSSGSDLNRFDILGIDSRESDEGDKLVLEGSTPATASHLGKFVVLDQFIADGKLGWAYVSGICSVNVDITNADHFYADVKNTDTTKLESAAIGAAKIIYKSSDGIGTKDCVVLLGAGEVSPPDVPDGTANGQVLSWDESGGQAWIAMTDDPSSYASWLLTGSGKTYSALEAPPGPDEVYIPVWQPDGMGGGTWGMHGCDIIDLP